MDLYIVAKTIFFFMMVGGLILLVRECKRNPDSM